MKYPIHPNAPLINRYFDPNQSAYIERWYTTRIWESTNKYYSEMKIIFEAYSSDGDFSAFQKHLEEQSMHENIDYDKRILINAEPR